MPEGPEVKLSADLIRPLVVNKTLKSAHSTANSRYGDSRNGYSSELGEFGRFQDFTMDTKVLSVDVRGKFMYWTFTDNWYMSCTFGMTGQWSPQEGKHPCFIFEFTDGSKMCFNDHRHFGTIKFTNNPQAIMDKLDELGWDPLSMHLVDNIPWLKSKLSRTGKPIAEVLMDQSVFAGVGNYIRAEALYLSKISPWRPANLLTPDEILRLGQSVVGVMNESYQHQGATISTYKTAYGEDGNYSTLFKVYGQKKDPLGNAIIKQKTPDKRIIHWCPSVQV
jgi:formamidopyrimidine-DNA glycosylase